MAAIELSSTSGLAGLIVPTTRARYGVLSFLGVLAFLMYLDRLCIAKAAPHIEAELHIGHTEMGFVFGAFTVA